MSFLIGPNQSSEPGSELQPKYRLRNVFQRQERVILDAITI